VGSADPTLIEKVTGFQYIDFEIVIEVLRSWEYSKLGVPLTWAA